MDINGNPIFTGFFIPGGLDENDELRRQVAALEANLRDLGIVDNGITGTEEAEQDDEEEDDESEQDENASEEDSDLPPADPFGAASDPFGSE